MYLRTDIVSSLILAVVAYAAVRIVLLLRKEKGQYPLPPGPKPWPVLGNITDMPKPGVREWEFWLKHKDTYGQSDPYDSSCSSQCSFRI